MIKQKELITRVEMFPKDANADGSIFGGVIVSHIDIAGAIAARACVREYHTKKLPRIVTKIMREIDFVAPVFIGDTVVFYAEINRVGRTSVTVRVEVVAERAKSGENVKVTEAELVYVAVDGGGRPTPIKKA